MAVGCENFFSYFFLIFQAKPNSSLNDPPPPLVQSNFNLAQEIGFTGTPAIVVMPTTGATPENTTVFAGFPGNPQDKPTESSVKAIQDAIDKASAKNKSTK